jgi:hypothetical protein
MRKYSYISLILVPLIVIVFFTGCPSKNGGVESYYIKATLDDTVYE